MKLVRLADDRFHTVLDKLSKEQLPLKTAFKLKGIINKVREEFTKYETVRKEALNKYGLKNDDGSLKLDDNNMVQFAEEGIKSFAQELNELGSMEIELPGLKLSELGDNVNITADELDAVGDVIVDG